jgi:hypothetical protein
VVPGATVESHSRPVPHKPSMSPEPCCCVPASCMRRIASAIFWTRATTLASSDVIEMVTPFGCFVTLSLAAAPSIPGQLPIIPQPSIIPPADPPIMQLFIMPLRKGGRVLDASGRWLVGAKGDYPF